MRVSKAEKDRSHQRIVASAARMSRQRGIAGTSVADVMSDAGLTHGGFYRHFDAKEALLEAALDAAFAEIVALFDRKGAGRAPADVGAAFASHYLSEGHVTHPGVGCPVAALAGDVARADAPLKATFGAGVQRIVERLAAGMSGSARERQAAAYRALATMAGAVAIARASDRATGRAVLAACREALVARGA